MSARDGMVGLVCACAGLHTQAQCSVVASTNKHFPPPSPFPSRSACGGGITAALDLGGTDLRRGLAQRNQQQQREDGPTTAAAPAGGSGRAPAGPQGRSGRGTLASAFARMSSPITTGQDRADMASLPEGCVAPPTALDDMAVSRLQLATAGSASGAYQMAVSGSGGASPAAPQMVHTLKRMSPAPSRASRAAASPAGAAGGGGPAAGGAPAGPPALGRSSLAGGRAAQAAAQAAVQAQAAAEAQAAAQAAAAKAGAEPAAEAAPDAPRRPRRGSVGSAARRSSWDPACLGALKEVGGGPGQRGLRAFSPPPPPMNSQRSRA